MGSTGYRLFARSADIVVSHSVWSREEAKRGYGVTAQAISHADGAMHEAYPPARPSDVVLKSSGSIRRCP